MDALSTGWRHEGHRNLSTRSESAMQQVRECADEMKPMTKMPLNDRNLDVN